MKINCEKCQAKYSIADEKVRGKTFKIRCKKCGHVIIVRDTASADQARSPAPQEAPGWHVAVGGETIGPLTEFDIRQRIEQGDFTQDASVWRDGFEDWVPMHAVDAFAQILDRVSPSRPSSAMDGVSMGGAADPDHRDPGGGEPSAPSSPRVQNLTAQRNENSVLFSLDSLQKVGSGATATQDAAAATLSPAVTSRANPQPLSGPGGSFTPATSAPTSEGSGLIDIRAMSAVLSSQGQAESKRDENLLPSFGGSGLGGLSVQPVPVEDPIPVVQDRGVAPEAGKRGNIGIWIFASVCAIACALGVGYKFVYEPMVAQGEQAAQDKVALAEQRVKMAEQKAALALAEERAKHAQEKFDQAQEAGENAKKSAAEARAAAAAAAAAQAAKAAAAAADATAPKSGSGSRRRGASGSRASGSNKGSGAANLPKVTGGSNKKKDSSIDVDCLLDPSLPKCGKKKSGGSKPKSGAATAPADSGLPSSLTQSQLLGGLRVAKSRAKGCGKKHGAAPGTRVRVRMSIAGSTGKVTSAVPQGEHASTPLGKCVAGFASQASFPKFGKSSQGLQYNFKM